MSCNFDKEIIQRYIDNRIDQLELLFLQEHIKYCADCNKELRLMEQVDQHLGAYFDLPLDCSRLDEVIAFVVEDLIVEKKNGFAVMEALRRSYKIGVKTVDRSASFIKYIPGSSMVPGVIKKTTKAASKAVGLMAKELMNRGLRRLTSFE